MYYNFYLVQRYLRKKWKRRFNCILQKRWKPSYPRETVTWRYKYNYRSIEINQSLIDRWWNYKRWLTMSFSWWRRFRTERFDNRITDHSPKFTVSFYRGPLTSCDRHEACTKRKAMVLARAPRQDWTSTSNHLTATSCCYLTSPRQEPNRPALVSLFFRFFFGRFVLYPNGLRLRRQNCVG